MSVREDRNNFRLAVLILIVALMTCASYLTGKFIDYKIAANQQTTNRMISFDARCQQAPSTCGRISRDAN